MDILKIHSLEATCILGTFPEERELPQSVFLDVEFHVNALRAGQTGELLLSCDYVEAAEAIRSLLCFRRYLLLETAAEELTQMLLACNPAAQILVLTLAKPGALKGLAKAASLTIRRERTPLPELEPAQGEHTTLLFESRESLLERVEVAPGVPLPSETSSEWCHRIPGAPHAYVRCRLR